MGKDKVCEGELFQEERRLRSRRRGGQGDRADRHRRRRLQEPSKRRHLLPGHPHLVRLQRSFSGILQPDIGASRHGRQGRRRREDLNWDEIAGEAIADEQEDMQRKKDQIKQAIASLEQEELDKIKKDVLTDSKKKKKKVKA